METKSSLQNKSAKKDFLRCLKQSIPIGVVIAIINLVKFASPILLFLSSQQYIDAAHTGEKYISFFGGIHSLGFEPDETSSLTAIFVFAGMLWAIELFTFILKKKQVNVYLSFGITRTRLLLNRVFAAALTMFLSVLIPLLVTVYLNVAAFGANKHIFAVFAYELVAMFSSMFVGFALATFCVVYSGNKIESIFFTFALAFIPEITDSIIDTAKSRWLFGYTANPIENAFSHAKTYIFSPWVFLTNLSNPKNITDEEMRTLVASPVDLLGALVKGDSIPYANRVTFGVILPIIIWLSISILLICGANFLLNKRKAENSNSFGKFKFALAVIGVGITLAIIDIVTDSVWFRMAFYKMGIPINDYTPKTVAMKIAVISVAAFLIFAITELIFNRSFKLMLKTLPIGAVLAVCFIFGGIFFSTAEFGTYNKTLDKSKVQSVYMSCEDPAGIVDSALYAKHIFQSTDIKDIETALSLYEEVKEIPKSDEKTVIPTVDFSFRLNDGTYYTRRFAIYDSDTADKYIHAVYNSNYYSQMLKYLFIDDPLPIETQSSFYDEYDLEDEDSYDYVHGNFAPGVYRTYEWKYLNGYGLYDGFNAADDEDIGPATVIQDSDALMKAVYSDLVKLDFDAFYKNPSRPIATLCAGVSEADKTFDEINLGNGYAAYDYDNLPTKTTGEASNNIIYIYPEMTETINYLKAEGYEVSAFTPTVKEVYVTNSKTSVAEAQNVILRKLAEDDSKILKNLEKHNDLAFYGGFVSGFNSKYFGNKYTGQSGTISYFDALNSLYNDVGLGLIKVDDSKMQSVAEASVPFYYYKNDNGRYAYIVFSDDTIIEAYIPEASLSVLN